MIEDWHLLRASLVTSQLPMAHWHEALGDPTLADAILDRLVHNAYRLELHGDSYRRSAEAPAAALAGRAATRSVEARAAATAEETG